MAAATAIMARQQVRSEQWNARAITLAEDARLVNRARCLGTGVRGESLWGVPSKSGAGTMYVVHVWPKTMGATCGCVADSYGRACAHAGAALLADRQRQACEGTDYRDAKSSTWLNCGEW